jgi:cytidylate kinase
VSARRPFIVAVDGPAGAGKSTTSRRLAARLGFAMVDTGAIYRTVALAASRAGIAFDDDERLGALLPAIRVRFEPSPPGSEGGGQRVFLGDEDVSLAIRTPPMSLGASAVSARPVVRAALLGLQRRLATTPGIRGAVLEGRDIGTVVFPTADAKYFLDAELQAKGDPQPFESVLADQRKRDRDDSSRDVAPLCAAADAVLVDTSSLSLDEVVARLADEVEARLAARG